MTSRRDLFTVLDFMAGYQGIPEKTTSEVLLIIVKTITIGELSVLHSDNMNTIINWYKENR
ncbi:MAG: hypothetical protein DRI65_13590 [Chloroflexota bacterium]|nr:MAG: hypothetical protein DRI65_13590 [Chloroflexota bacterium]